MLQSQFNLAPSLLVPLVRESMRGRDAVLARWGLVPFWADDPSIGNRLANARGDSVASKPSFREAFMHRRGLMPADLFYEWQVIAGRKVKQPWCVRLPGDEPFSFGALWERWTPRSKPDADALITCAIVTTEANALMAPIHHRMPLIIAADDYAVWLDPRTPQAIAQSLIRPYAGRLQAWPVSTRVNSARNNDEACIAPLP